MEFHYRFVDVEKRTGYYEPFVKNKNKWHSVIGVD